ncbi:MAG: hypothetical protein LBU15_01500 [Rickettsiales bacterium]|jgi:hypothetical protein|nr:hypothetical protein [Rickettsiales bacterium]
MDSSNYIEGLVGHLNSLGIFPGEVLTVHNIGLLNCGTGRAQYIVKSGMGDFIVKDSQNNVYNQVYCQYCKKQGGNLHPSLARVIYAGDASLVVKYCDEKNLGDLVRSPNEQKRFRARLAIEKSCGALLEGLSCLQKEGIGLKDIGLDSMVCGEDGNVIIADFESAHSYDKTGEYYMKHLPPSHVALEVLTSTEGHDCGKANLWAMALTMLCALVGEKDNLMMDFAKKYLGDRKISGPFESVMYIREAFEPKNAQGNWNSFILNRIDSMSPPLYNAKLWQKLFLGMLQIDPARRLDMEKACKLANNITSLSPQPQMMKDSSHSSHQAQQVDQLQQRQPNNNMLLANQIPMASQQQLQLQQGQLQQRQPNNNMLLVNQIPMASQQQLQLQQLQLQQGQFQQFQPQQTNNVFQQTNQLQMGSSRVNQLPMGQIPYASQQMNQLQQNQLLQNQPQQTNNMFSPNQQTNQLQSEQGQYTFNVIDLSEEIEESRRKEEEKKKKEEELRKTLKDFEVEIGQSYPNTFYKK